MGIGKAIRWYLLIGVVLMPLIYWNNANGSRDAGKAETFGMTVTTSLLFWPSYLFSIEPEIDGDSATEFDQSIRKMLDYRNNKWFAGSARQGAASENFSMVNRALAYCAVVFDKRGRLHELNGWNSLRHNLDDPYFKSLHEKLMDHFDGQDFAGVIKRGNRCLKNPF